LYSSLRVPMKCTRCKVQPGCENQLEKGEAFQDLRRLDLAEDEIRADQDQGIVPACCTSNWKLRGIAFRVNCLGD